MIELKIKRVVRQVRTGWDDDNLWQGASEEPMLLEGIPEPDLDDDRPEG